MAIITFWMYWNELHPDEIPFDTSTVILAFLIHLFNPHTGSWTMDFLACLDDYQYLRQTLAVPLREKILICRDLLASQTCPLLSSVTLQLHHCLICAAVIKRNLKHYVASELDICLIKSHYSISFTSRSYEKISTHIHLVLANIS